VTGTHGHVNPRPDGSKTRCGGPRLCKKCAAELADALAHIAPELLDALRQLGDTYGPLGVAVAAARLTKPAAVIRALTAGQPQASDPPPHSEITVNITSPPPASGAAALRHEFGDPARARRLR
jgi:hypothetical protein